MPMTAPLRHLPWIGGSAAASAQFSPLVSPIDESVAAQIIESDAGIVDAAVTPFNGPVNLLIQKVAPALAMGNAVVVKPSPPGTEVALLIAEAMQKAKLPDGLYNVVPGGRETARLLAAHPLVAAITVTGS